MKILFIESDRQYLLGLPFGLQNQGCQVKVLNDIIEEELDKVLEEYRPDLILTTGWTKIHSKTKLAVLKSLAKKHKVKQAYWATEDPRWTDEWSLPYIEATGQDYIFTINRGSIPYYRKKGYHAHYLPWACNPEFHRPHMQQDFCKCDIAVLATAGVTWNSYRKNSVQILLKPLLEKGYNIMIWGSRWDKLDSSIVGFSVDAGLLRGKLPYRESNYVYSTAKIVLGLQNTTRELTSRTFEVLGAKGFLLTPATPAIMETFIPGTHLAVSRSASETLEKVNYYLAHEEEKMSIATAGQAEVYAKHTYNHRAADIIKVVG